MAGQRIRITRLETVGQVIAEHARVYRELRRGKLEPSKASRLSQLLTNHRSMLEVQVLEQQVEEMRAILAATQQTPLRLINGKSPVAN